MKPTLIFIHGMFQNARSWDNWTAYFSLKGYECIAESWPLHEGDPASLRSAVPEGLGDLRLSEVIDKYEQLARSRGSNAILIGHSVGGLIVQNLISKGLGRAGVCISSVAPNRMLAFDWGFFKNSISIANPFKGDEPFMMTPEGFHASFANTLERSESDAAYEKSATHDSRNILRDCMLADGEIDLEKTDRPLLFIGGSEDQIIPAELNEKNAKAYHEGLAAFVEFPNRSHYICNEPRWTEIADHVSLWLDKNPVKDDLAV